MRNEKGQFIKGLSPWNKGMNTVVRVLNCTRCNGAISRSATYTTTKKICKKCHLILRAANAKGRTPNVECENCQKPIYRCPWQIKKQTFISCGACKAIVQAKHPENFKAISTNDYGNRFKFGQKLSNESKQNISKAIRRGFKDGTRKSWIKGLTSSTSESVKKISQSKLGIKRPDVAGKNNHNWKGGVTSQNNLDRAKFRQTINKLVFERDNYTCQLCGDQEYLHVDHIQKWSDFVDQRFSLDNCRTVCRECHYQITFGKPLPHGSKWGILPTTKKENML